MKRLYSHRKGRSERRSDDCTGGNFYVYELNRLVSVLRRHCFTSGVCLWLGNQSWTNHEQDDKCKSSLPCHIVALLASQRSSFALPISHMVWLREWQIRWEYNTFWSYLILVSNSLLLLSKEAIWCKNYPNQPLPDARTIDLKRDLKTPKSFI